MKGLYVVCAHLGSNQRLKDDESIGWRYMLDTKTVFNGLQK